MIMNIGGLLLTVVFIVWDNNGALWQRGSMYIYIFGIDTHTVPAGGSIYWRFGTVRKIMFD